VGLNDAGRSYAYIRAYNPTKGNWSIFQAQLLPFGAVKSVHAFLCLARAVWWLGAVGCYLFWSSFFDDCIVFSLLPCLNFWVGSSLKMGGSAIFLLFVVKP
jgi:hypothetical protein